MKSETTSAFKKLFGIIEIQQSIVILLMEEILHQLRFVVYPIIYRVSYMLGGAGCRPSTVVIDSKDPPLKSPSRPFPRRIFFMTLWIEGTT